MGLLANSQMGQLFHLISLNNNVIIITAIIMIWALTILQALF